MKVYCEHCGRSHIEVDMAEIGLCVECWGDHLHSAAMLCTEHDVLHRMDQMCPACVEQYGLGDGPVNIMEEEFE